MVTGSYVSAAPSGVVRSFILRSRHLSRSYSFVRPLTFQRLFEVATHGRGMTEITLDVARVVSASNVACGVAHVFCRHTSCSVLITENADPSVRRDLEMLAARWAPDGDGGYEHDTEGADDMAAHARTLL